MALVTFLKRPVLICLGLFAGLLLAEIICRVLRQKSIHDLAARQQDLYYYYDTNGHRRHLPNRVGQERAWNDQGKVTIRTNQWGLRRSSLELYKLPQTKKLLFIGDSITLSARLAEKDTFVHLVGEKLAADMSHPIDAINGGVQDVGIEEEDALLRRVGPLVSPDWVILQWYLNDARPPQGFREEVIYNNRLVRFMQNSPLLAKSQLASVIYKTYRQLLLKRHLEADGLSQRFFWVTRYDQGRWRSDPAEWDLMRNEARFDWGDAWNSNSMEKMFKEIFSLRSEVKKQGANLAIVASPAYTQVVVKELTQAMAQPQEQLAAFCKKEGIPLLDLLPKLREKAEEPFFYDHCHYSPAGSRFVADQISEFLLPLLQGG